MEISYKSEKDIRLAPVYTTFPEAFRLLVVSYRCMPSDRKSLEAFKASCPKLSSPSPPPIRYLRIAPHALFLTPEWPFTRLHPWWHFPIGPGKRHRPHKVYLGKPEVLCK